MTSNLERQSHVSVITEAVSAEDQPVVSNNNNTFGLCDAVICAAKAQMLRADSRHHRDLEQSCVRETV